MAGIAADPTQRAPRPAPGPRGWRARLRPGLAASLGLHGGLAALVVLAALGREPPSEPLPAPAYSLLYEPEAGAQPAGPTPIPDIPVPPAAAPPPAPEPEPAPQPTVTPPPPPPAPRSATPAPRPNAPRGGAQRQAALAPPVAPPPAPAAPQPTQPQAAPQPEAPAAPSTDALPGLWLPQSGPLAPAQDPPPRPTRSAARPLDLTIDPATLTARPAAPSGSEAQLEVRGARVTPDWRSAFARWWIENRSYPDIAVELGQQGTNRVQIIADPDGRVRSVRLIRPSGSAWLDGNSLSTFRGAMLPAFPPGADPRGVTLDFTIHYILTR